MRTLHPRLGIKVVLNCIEVNFNVGGYEAL